MGNIFAGKWQYQQQSTQFLKGQLIILPHVDHEYIYTIQEGAVKSFDITPEGTENTIAILGPDDLFPINRLFSRRREGAHYQAFTDCMLWKMPRKQFAEELAQDSETMQLMMSYLAQKDLDYQLRIRALEQLRADFKLAYTLAFLVRKFGKSSSGHTAFEVEVPFTQRDFASLIGLTRETTCIQLKKLERLGIVRHKHRRYVVYREKLHDFVAEELVPLA